MSVLQSATKQILASMVTILLSAQYSVFFASKYYGFFVPSSIFNIDNYDVILQWARDSVAIYYFAIIIPSRCVIASRK